MEIKRLKSNSEFPLVVEDYPLSYKGYEFITLIKYNDEKNLSIIDNVGKRHITAFCLDLCGPQKVSEEEVIAIALKWYTSSRDLYPVSIEFCKEGFEQEASRIVKSYSIDYVSRVIGPVFCFDVSNPRKIRKRKRKIHKNTESFQDSVADFKTLGDYLS